MAVIIAITAKPKMESIEFKAPEGLEIPEGTNPGDTFEVMATVALGKEGELYLKEIDGMPVSGVEQKEEEVPETKEEMPEQDGGFLEAVERRASES